MKKMLSLCALGCTVAFSGCAAFVDKPGESNYSWLGGTLTVVEGSAYGATVHATMAAMSQLQLSPTVYEQDGFRASIAGSSTFGRFNQSHEIRVWVDNLSDSATKIRMRISGRRDQARLRTIHEAIHNRLSVGDAAVSRAN